MTVPHMSIPLSPASSSSSSYQGTQPLMYFCKYGGEVLRACAIGDGGARNRDQVWGGKEVW